MKISTKGRYGIIALVDLFINSNSESTTIKAIAERQQISERYLEQIFSMFRKSGIIIGKKGAQGGYTVLKKSSELTLGEILRSVEGESFLVEVDESINEIDRFINDNVWKDINDKVNKYFDSITLEKIIDEYRKGKEEIIYYI